MIIIKKIWQIIIIILLIVLIILLNIIIIETKEKVVKNYFDNVLNTKEYACNFIDITKNENLRRYYLKEYLENYYSYKYNCYNDNNNDSNNSDNSNNGNTNNDNSNNDIYNTNKWFLEIPSINLNANIVDGTNEKVLNNYIGHFEESEFLYGNVGLAAHNRGYPINHFKNLDKLKIGDYIDYRIDDFLIKYKISSIKIIKDTDWTYLQNTNEDKITLITCVKNKPDYRLCVQAHKESEEFINNAKKDFNSRNDNNLIIKCDISRNS